MSLFQCEVCGCCENTALASQGFKKMLFMNIFSWAYAPEREGLELCSACGPTNYRSGEPTEYGKWHGEFPRVFLEMGKWKTNSVGNLEHVDTGATDFMAHAVPPPAFVEFGEP